MIQTFDYFSTKPLVEEALKFVKRLTMGDSAKEEEHIQELFGETEFGACFEKEEEMDSILLERACLEKEKGKMVYIVDDEEVENLDIEHSQGVREVLDSADKDTCTYHEPMKTKKVNIGSEAEPKEAIIGDYWSDSEVAKIIELLRDYQDLFPRGYHELKGVHESLR
ncbi:hypothetical protein KI387_005538 [Taxus chinensis]|uniref:Uncharacterized protein n=1 Tax=Taxus chinensis TaxID=29808 RepID=A0AA38GP05_TAXCH|nr:hypothetical protein KI387_005538 [Taxus chinensis]